MVLDFHPVKVLHWKTPLAARVNVPQSMSATQHNSYIKHYGYHVKVKINEQTGARFILLPMESR